MSTQLARPVKPADPGAGQALFKEARRRRRQRRLAGVAAVMLAASVAAALAVTLTHRKPGPDYAHMGPPVAVSAGSGPVTWWTPQRYSPRRSSGRTGM